MQTRHKCNAAQQHSGTMNWNDFRDWMDCGLLCTKQLKNICKSIIGRQVSSFSHVDITYLHKIRPKMRTNQPYPTCSCPYKRAGVRGPASNRHWHGMLSLYECHRCGKTYKDLRSMRSHQSAPPNKRKSFWLTSDRNYGVFVRANMRFFIDSIYGNKCMSTACLEPQCMLTC